jgi:hypothetical protein
MTGPCIRNDRRPIEFRDYFREQVYDSSSSGANQRHGKFGEKSIVSFGQVNAFPPAPQAFLTE